MIEDGGPTCDALAGAVVAAISVLLDETAAPAARTEANAPRPPTLSDSSASPASRVAVPDPDDIPPGFEPQRATSPGEPTTEMRWYGFQTLVTDGAALALGIPSVTLTPARGATVFGIAGFSMYTLGAPIVHVAHGHVLKALSDLRVRVGLPLVAGLVGGVIGGALYTPPLSVRRCANGDVPSDGTLGGAVGSAAVSAVCQTGEDTDGVYRGFAIGGLIGMATSSALDAFVFAREPVPRSAESGVRPPAPSPSLQPTLGLTPERTGGARGMLGIAGVF